MRVPYTNSFRCVGARALRGDVKINKVTCKNMCTLCMRSTFHLITVAQPTRQRAACIARLECVNDLVACLSAAPKSRPHTHKTASQLDSQQWFLLLRYNCLSWQSVVMHFFSSSLFALAIFAYSRALIFACNSNHDSHHCRQTCCHQYCCHCRCRCCCSLNSVPAAVTVAAAVCGTTQSKAQCDACCDAGKTRKWFFIKMT